MTPITGQCLCGAVRFRIHGPLAPVQVCHCTDCRRAQGTPFATNAPVRRDDVVFTSDTDTLTAYESTPGKRRWFCSRCGSPLYSERTDLPGIVRLRVGLLDEPVTADVEAHAFWASRARWFDGAEERPHHDRWLPKPP